MPETGVKYAKVIADILARQLDRCFQYRIPKSLEDKIVPGSTVVIPFGKGDRHINGYVLEIGGEPEFDPEKTKEILEVITGSDQVESKLVSLAAWMSRSYGSTMAAALRVVFPVKKQVKSKELKYICLAADAEECKRGIEYFEKKHQIARLRLLTELMADKELPWDMVTGKLGCGKGVIEALEKKGLCRVRNERVYRGSAKASLPEREGNILNEEQERTVRGILEGFDGGKREVSLIKGVTGSGKTEVYIRLAEEMVKRGRQAIVLIPEIALTYQTLMRFYRVFKDRAAMLHSRLSPAERYDQFERAQRGEVDVVIGPRSALFAPLSRLGIIIIDEEHEGSYKSEAMPRYHARETALERARLQDSLVVLGSATPSLEAYYRAIKGEYRLYELTKRATGGCLPEVSIVDLRKELLSGNKTAISRSLREAIARRLEKGEQTMLFINRRGFAGFVSCRSCGYTYSCPHCDVSLSLHRGSRLVCHYCGYEEFAPKVCKNCGSGYVGSMRAGTEAIELAVQRLFPQARCLRMDMDTTRGKDGHERIITAFMNGEADILIGTQMKVKGHDFPNVTLVGILAADMSLYSGDYRAGERTFQLLTQAAGRAGRGDKPGEVIIQTYNPEDPHIVFSSLQDYEGFYEAEIGYRKLCGYPPAGHLLGLLLEDRDEKRLLAIADRIKAECRAAAGDIQVIGPARAAIAYINDVHRYVIYIKSSDYDILVGLKDRAERLFNSLKAEGKYKGSDCLLTVDFDPVNGF